MNHKTTGNNHPRAELYTPTPAPVDVYVGGKKKASYTPTKDEPTFLFRLDYRGNGNEAWEDENIAIDAAGDYLQMAVSYLSMLDAGKAAKMLSEFGLKLEENAYRKWEKIGAVLQ